MKLGIISDSHHYYVDGRLYNHNALLAKQFKCLAELFDDVIVCAPLLNGQPPATSCPYGISNIHLLPIINAGGHTLNEKIELLYRLPGWWRALRDLLKQVDAVHIRCPNNISILGLLMLETSRILRQAVYTGSWLGHLGDPPTYQLQRWFLRHRFRGPVAVYGDWPGQPTHIVPSFSPSYSEADWKAENLQVNKRVEGLERLACLSNPVHLMSVGWLNKNKNQALILKSMHYMIEQGIDCTLDLLGDGDQRLALEKQAKGLGLKEKVFFRGNVAHSIVREFYRQSDFVIQAPYSEGFGKVPIEAFFHGAVPILSDVDMSSQIIGMGIRGRCFPQGDARAIAQHVLELAQDPASMAQMIKNGREYALGLTMEAWQQHLCKMLNDYWGQQLKIPLTCSEKTINLQ